MAIVFERLIGRQLVRYLSSELDLAGIKTTVNGFITFAIVSWIVILVLASFYTTLALKFNPLLALFIGIVASVIFEFIIYALLEFRIEQRKDFIESILPDYLQLTAAEVRGGMSISKAMTTSARPEFKFFNDDLELLSKQLYSGETMQNALNDFANRYRSNTLRRTMRMINETVQYGGGMMDLLNQISRDLRNQQIIQKEVSGQLFMYTIFIAFAALIGAPALYGITNEMITITTQVWSKISIGALGSVPSVGVSFIHFSKPQITAQAYGIFALVAILIITGFGAFIVAAISTGVVANGLKYFPIFLLVGFGVYFVVSSTMAGFFTSIGGI
ncbi:MAG: type II secretion system F family protein [Candidatus Micrarchaeota archaeon]|nr:type II secretion system F family protein [Candidatus Micrarchaeota archaeon]MDE1849955.1 type II secretion system F family protein [Candidatus Micrarchaeota archaeon]